MANPAKPPTYVGVDGCRAGWIFVALDRDGYRCGVVPTIGALFTELPDPAVVFLDMPIGLPDEGPTGRACDTAARKLLGPRRSSVFSAPVRSVLAAANYAEAGRLTNAAAGKGLSKQAYALVPKIREIDDLLQTSEKARSVVREAHPEISFWALAGGRPMTHYKKKEAGFRERMALLEQVHPGAEDIVARAFLWSSGQGAARDDVVDAVVNAVAAWQGGGVYRTLPENPPRDATGLPMEIVFPPF